MRRLLLATLVPFTALSLGTGCVHAKKVGDGKPDTSASASTSASAKESPAAPKNLETEGHATPPSDTSPKKVASASTPGTGGAGANAKSGPAEPAHPPLASSPGELRTPEGTKMLVGALVDQGFLRNAAEGGSAEALSLAIRKFQTSQSLPETGFADRTTIVKLGLDPKKVDKVREPTGEVKKDREAKADKDQAKKDAKDKKQ